MTYKELYIGLMSGTSIDGVDVALVDFSNDQCELIACYLHPIPIELKKQLARISTPSLIGSRIEESRIELMARLDIEIAEVFADAVNCFISSFQLNKSEIVAIGSHGQTIRHRAENKPPFTLQIGDANIIAERTGITTVADFRRMDMAAGGQGAPLAPAFHNSVLRSPLENRIILNLGGIANITLLRKSVEEPVIGFDTGPANTLMDAWFTKNHPSSEAFFDRNSNFALEGKSVQKLLSRLLDDPYFKLPPPKSSGREYFSLDWLEQHLSQIKDEFSSADVQRTLLDLTVKSVADAIRSCYLDSFRVLSCGGGMHNETLLDCLSKELGCSIDKTNNVGIDGDYLEAMTFAWLAKQRIRQLPGSLSSVTGARSNKILGAVYLG